MKCRKSSKKRQNQILRSPWNLGTGAWLEQVSEEILEPELPICDPHHHLWDHPDSRYLLDELIADTGSGHNVVSTVFVATVVAARR